MLLSVLCEQCQNQRASVFCEGCPTEQRALCIACDRSRHVGTDSSSHIRYAILGAVSPMGKPHPEAAAARSNRAYGHDYSR